MRDKFVALICLAKAVMCVVVILFFVNALPNLAAGERSPVSLRYRVS